MIEVIADHIIFYQTIKGGMNMLSVYVIMRGTTFDKYEYSVGVPIAVCKTLKKAEEYINKLTDALKKSDNICYYYEWVKDLDKEDE